MTQDSVMLRPRERIWLRALVCVMFFLFAMTTDAVGSVISTVIREMHLSMTAAGAFHYAPMMAIAAGGLGLGFLADRWGRRGAILAGLLMYGVGSALFAVGSQFSHFVTLLAVSGVGISVFKVGGLALVGDLTSTRTEHKQFMNSIEGFFAIGSIVGPGIVAALINSHFSWRWLYVIAAGICLLLVLVTSRIRFPDSKPDPQSIHHFAAVLDVLRAPGIFPLAALMMLYVGVEVAVYVWMPTYLEQYRGRAHWLALYALTLFFILRAVGRFLGVWLLGVMRPSTLLALASIGVFACVLLSTIFGASFAAWLLPLSGIAMSVIYPTLNSDGISQFPAHRQGAAAGVLLFFTALAAALGPLAMAAVSDIFGDARYGFVLASGFALLLALGLVFMRMKEYRSGRSSELPVA